nr:hypothetical protein [Aquicoccus sp. G2-2]MEA1115201.1 hypothetical protein [Aquicoccus sp. G2-2]
MIQSICKARPPRAIQHFRRDRANISANQPKPACPAQNLQIYTKTHAAKGAFRTLVKRVHFRFSDVSFGDSIRKRGAPQQCYALHHLFIDLSNFMAVHTDTYALCRVKNVPGEKRKTPCKNIKILLTIIRKMPSSAP